MSKKFLVYFLLWILFQVLFDVNCQITPFKSSALYFHTTTLIDNKLYILSDRKLPVDGKIDGDQVKEFFYLDVSAPFNTQELSWKDLSKITMVPLHSSATSAKGGAINDTLYLYGGFTNDSTMALVYTFDPQHIVWNSQEITGINSIRKHGLTGVIDYSGKFYLWGGRTVNGLVNDMLILDTMNFSWRKGSSVNAPIARYRFGATLLPNNKIIYIGGMDDVTITFNTETLNINKGIASSLKEVYIYDTINDNWDTKITTGKIPSNRGGFSTILGLDGQRVIIYGGVFNYPGYVDSTLYVLDLTNFNWYIPKINGNIPKPRAYHKANVISRYMVITFGRGYDRTVESDILLLDISNNEEYVWTTKFDPSVPTPPSSTPPSPPTPSSSDNSKMVGAIVGSLLSSIFLSVGCFFLYKWNKKRQSQNNNNNYNNYGQEEKVIPTERDIHSKNENITNHEPVSAIVNNEEILSTPNNDGFKFFKLLNKKLTN